MQISFRKVAKSSPEVGAALAEARSARNRQTRLERQAAKTEEIEISRARRRRRRKEKEEDLNLVLGRRIRIFMDENVRPKIGRSTARKLIHRTSGDPFGTVGVGDFRGPDGRHSIHFEFTPRGFASWRGRCWRPGEAERAARYITREEGLEGGEHGWWSNVADDRTQLVGFFRTLEALEEHDRKNANVYVSEIIALPAELTPKQRRHAVRRICQFFEERSLGYVAALHLPDRDGDQRNFHCHILYSLRPCERVDQYDWSFAVAKENNINTPDGIRSRRRQVVRDINKTLCAARIDKHLTHLSNKARGMKKAEPTSGQISTAIGRRLSAMESRKALLEKISLFASNARAKLNNASGKLSQLGSVARYRLDRSTRLKELKQTIRSRNSARATSIMNAQNTVSQSLRNLREILATSFEGNGVQIRSQAAGMSKKIQPIKTVLRTNRNGNHSAIRTAGNVISARSTNAQSKLYENFDDLKHMTEVARSRTALVYRAISARVGDNSKRIAVVRDRALDMNALLKKRELLETAETERVNRDGKLLSAYSQTLLKQLEVMLRKLVSRHSYSQHLGETRAHVSVSINRIGEAIASNHQACSQALDHARPTKASLSKAVPSVPAKLLTEVKSSDGPTHTTIAASAPLATPDQSDNAKGSSQDGRAEVFRQGKPQPIRTAASATQARRSSDKATGARIDFDALRREARRRGASESDGTELTPARGSFSKERAWLEDLRDIVREHKPHANLVMHRSRSNSVNSDQAAETRCHAELGMEMLRREAKRREKRVREKLLSRVRKRLLSLEVPLAREDDGTYKLEKGRIPDDEYFVLMRCNPPETTQAFLNYVGSKQSEKSADARAPGPHKQNTERDSASGDPDEWNLTMQRYVAEKSGRSGK